MATLNPAQAQRPAGTEDVIDYTIKVLLLGDSGVGKTCLLQRFTSGYFDDQVASTIGVDFATKCMQLYDKSVKVQIWDTAGQEKFRTLTSTFYRGAKGIILVYDVTHAVTLHSLEAQWLPELERYDADENAARMVVANKVDVDHREVSWAEGADFARRHGCLFVETSARTNIAVNTAFEELVLKVLDTPCLLDDVGGPAGSSRPGSVALGAPAGQGYGLASNCAC